MTVQEMPRRQTTPLIRGTKLFVHGNGIFHASTSPINLLIFGNLYIFETGKRPLGRPRADGWIILEMVLIKQNPPIRNVRVSWTEMRKQIQNIGQKN
jgi:hypothetical protein